MVGEVTTIPFSFVVQRMEMNPKRATKPAGEYMINGIPVRIDPTIPEDEIRITSGDRLVVMKLKPQSTEAPVVGLED